MNPRPIEQAIDVDLRLSMVALRRAALRARDVALRTGTELIVVESGRLRRIAPSAPSDQARYRVQDGD